MTQAEMVAYDGIEAAIGDVLSILKTEIVDIYILEARWALSSHHGRTDEVTRAAEGVDREIIVSAIETARESLVAYGTFLYKKLNSEPPDPGTNRHWRRLMKKLARLFEELEALRDRIRSVSDRQLVETASISEGYIHLRDHYESLRIVLNPHHSEEIGADDFKRSCDWRMRRDRAFARIRRSFDTMSTISMPPPGYILSNSTSRVNI